MRIAAAIVLVLTTMATSAEAQSVADLMRQMRQRWVTPTEPFRIIDNVYYVGTAGLSSFLVTSPEGHILLDTGLPDSAPLIKANIAKLGFKLGDIKYLLNSHAHFDHAGALAELKRDTGAQMVASAADTPLLEGGYYPGRKDKSEWGFPPVKVDRIIGQGDKITIGKVTMTANITPGHSPGCTSWTTVAREKKWNHTVVFFCSASVAANRLVGNITHPGIVDDYRKTFAAARGIIADVFLAPHPEMFKMEEKRALIGKYDVNPFIKAGEFHSFVKAAEASFNTELAKQKATMEARN
jgi:metallo-beta-lactamase class B